MRQPNDAALVVRDRSKTLPVIGWIIAGVTIYSLQYELSIFGSLLCGLFLLGASIALIWMLARQNITQIGAALMAVAIAGLFFYGTDVVRFARFRVLKPGYLKIVDEAERGLTENERIATRRSGFHIDDGEPVRVAFPWNGIIDNWYGVVFDPTDELSRFCGDAGRDGLFLKDPDLRDLFGGDMTYCEKLEKGWYFCWFT